MASKVASILRGKHKAVFSPHVDAGDFVVVINAGKVRVTGDKKENKEYFRHSGYVGGTTVLSFDEQTNAFPHELLKRPARYVAKNQARPQNV